MAINDKPEKEAKSKVKVAKPEPKAPTLAELNAHSREVSKTIAASNKKDLMEALKATLN